MRLVYFFIVFNAIQLYSQTKINGVVVNKINNAIGFASVQLVDKQTDLTQNYTTTNEKGVFSLEIPSIKKQYYLKVRLLGYQPKNIQLTNFNKLNITLQENTNELEEVVVKGYLSDFKISKDSITYNLSKIIDSTEINLKDIIEKLPGLSIDDQKKIKFQGNRIEKVTIDGQDFFGKKHEMATENLSAEAIKGIQLLKNHKDFDDISTKKTGKIVLNITLNKKYKNKIVGNIAGKLGVLEKHQAHLNLFKFLNKGNFALISEANNIGETAINMIDYIEMRGGIKNFTKNNLSDGSGILEIDHSKTPRFVFVNKNVDERKTLFNSINFTNTLSEKAKINGYITVDKTKIEEFQSGTKKYISQDVITINEDKKNSSNSYLGNSFFNFSYKKNKKEVISYNLKFNIIDDKSISTINQLFNIKSRNKNKGFSIGHNLSYKKQFNSKYYTEIAVYHDIKNIENNLFIIANKPFLGLNFTNKYSLKNVENDKLNSLNLDFLNYYKFSRKTNLASKISYVYSDKNILNTSTQNNLSFHLKNTKKHFRLKNTINHRINRHFYTKLSLNYLINDITVNSKNKKQYWLLPYILLKYKHNNQKSINFSFFQNKQNIPVFQTNTNQTILDFQTKINSNTAVFTPISKQHFNLNYNNYTPLTNSMFSIKGTYSISKNNISFNTLFKDNYIEQSYIRVPEKGFGLDFSYHKTIKYLKLKYNLSSIYNHINTISYFNGDKNIKNNTSYQLRLNLNSILKKNSVQAKCKLQYTTIIDKNNFYELNYAIHKINISPEIYGKHHEIRWNIGNSYTNTISNDEKQHINSLNFSLSYKLNKKIELFCKGNNILNLKSNQIISYLNTRYFYQFTKSEQLEGNILAGLRYHF
ncbi:carboxypeptidase-like regulatory domain-containing protein [Tenacibaculum finnmarkense genomovar finnmarkense]|uniref:carboxypeptidase-like regulatory domain-containing protein n=1 Tax=Tenacibaculum finnmarkense TaxID=2781243 RepID=UPI001E42773A|nr:carboxypeptidase-like regulatory domain-containing protein [Tenacibaculum finnmarkense]MCD8416362.1 carboxypeptidase-like regulatory domain-containing protein [Tenacibaculum finnmarkense genomovar finnmarkense]MCG8185022.1 carboxypeptidase-like regulatory domain-containing protein [Tenacibaculum finnmarkense genomovar finnmarkense]MCG8201144.1 carboxypeptidase-like regulatory domain-containing protein [Tenacibaculum finnmarkense genomovar finnmarkense]MCG8208981.1 carboxypeptidase-like regul